MTFSPAKKHDDQERIRSDIAHDVRIGGKAQVRLGGMATATLEVIAIGKDGIQARDSKGRTYKFLWEHVVGPADSKAEVDDVKQAGKPRDEPLLQKSVPTPPEQKQPPHRALYAGDSIYFSDDSGRPQYGTVAAVGKDGAQIDCQADDGKITTRNVRHHRIIGHRKRAERKLTIVDRGEDGNIAVDDAGKRVFLRGQIPDDEPDLDLQKALSGTVETADEARTAALVEPLYLALETMQASHQHEIARLASIVAALAGQQPQAITVQMPEAPVAHVDVHVPAQPAPVVNVAAPDLPAPIVHVTLPEPPARKIINIERDRDGNIARAIQTEKS